MNKNLFEIPGFDTQFLNDGSVNYPTIVFRKIKGDFMTTFKRSAITFRNNKFIEDNSEKIKSLIYNEVEFEDKVYWNEEELSEFINTHYPKYTPEEKLKNVLESLSKLSTYDGDSSDISIEKLKEGEIWRANYLSSYNELVFYMQNLQSQKLIKFIHHDDYFRELTITLEGLTVLTHIKEKKNSRYCFVAMSFSASERYIYDEAILPAIIEAKFLPLIVSDRHVNSENTINDEIIACIKKSKFTIADFTKHKHGVYFEAGYALGRGQKVIYTCHMKDIKKAHFDTRNFQHIVWETTDDFKKKLIDKINAFIID